MRRFYSLDVLRGLAALAVVVHHWQWFFLAGDKMPPGWSASSLPLHNMLAPIYSHGHLGVGLFFCLSGFIFFWLYSERVNGRMPAVEFVRLRFARLYPLHLAALLAVVALQWAHTQISGSFFVYRADETWRFLLNALMVQFRVNGEYAFNAPDWSLSIEVLLYSAFFVLCRAGQSGPMKLSAIVIASATFLSDFPAMKLGLTAFFSGGLSFYAYRWITKRERQVLDPVIRWAAIAAWSLPILFHPSSVIPFLTPAANDYWPTLVMFPLAVLAIAVTETRRGSIGKRMAFIGDSSYAIYLLHLPMMIVASIAATWLGVRETIFYSPLALLVFLSALVAFSAASYYRFEMPMRSWILDRARLGSSRLTPVRVHDEADIRECVGE